MNLAILPLALTMLAGPQVMSAIIFVTSKRPMRVSATFIIGVAITATAGVLIAIDVGSLLGSNRSHSTYGGLATTQAILQALTGRGNLPQFAIVAPTLVIAALFDPLRRRIQYFIDPASTAESTTPRRPSKPSLSSCAARRTWPPWVTA